ncbi:MAG: hypothetical protein CMA28_02535 [Euryarchaeota archaeon]|nr:hypothetical protein [Euryarchaeota archaeon]
MFKINNDKLLSTLLEVYRFEVPRVSGPHGGRPGFRPWSIEEICSEIPDINHDESLDKLIHLLIEERQLLRIPAYGEHPEKFLTRTAEMVRTIGTIHEYVARETEDVLEGDAKRHLQIIEATKWVPAPMERPARVVSIEQFTTNLSEQMEIHDIQIYRGQSRQDILQLVAMALKAIASAENISEDAFKLTLFQERAIYTALITSWTGVKDAPMIICAGTGSGKTIGFTVPVLVDAIIDTIDKQRHDPEFRGRWTQMMVYPRNDLAFDQYKTLSGYCGKLNEILKRNGKPELNLTIALDAGGMIKNFNEKISGKGIGEWDGQSEKKNWGKNTNVVTASRSRYGGVAADGNVCRAANIMIVSSESFRRRLAIPDVVGVVKNIQRVVLDEIHLAEGINGGHLRGMFDRLAALRDGKRPLFIAASATIAEERRHVESIWGVREDLVQVIQPTENEKRGRAGGIANHILVRPRAGVTKGGPVYNTTSLVGHQSKEEEWGQLREDAADDLENWNKILCFADSREFVGRWQMIMNENEGGMHKMRIRERQLSGSGAIKLPFAHWFDRPLAQQLGHDRVCTACTKGEKLENSITVQAGKIREFRTKWGGKSKDEYFVMENWHEDDDDMVEINSLDQCPHLQAGTCWHFAPGIGPSPITGEADALAIIRENLIERPGTGKDKVFRNALRFRRHHAESKKDNSASDGLGIGEEQFSAAEHYRHTSGEAYPSLRPGDWEGHSKIIHDGVIATPTLEVGVDMKKLGNVITHRAMRNRASYRQKAGRAGREEGSVSNVVTILSRRPGDYQFYRDEQSLIIDDLKEIVPVANRNRMIMRSQAYMAVLDWLAFQGIDIEQIGSDQWIQNLHKAVERLNDDKQDIADWIWKGFRHSVIQKSDVYTAIGKMRAHLDLIANGKFHAKNVDDELTISEELKRVIAGKTRHGSNPDQKKFRMPETQVGSVDEYILNQFRVKWGESKSVLDSEWNTRIGELLDRVLEPWFKSPSTQNQEDLVNDVKEISTLLQKLAESSERIVKRKIRKMCEALTSVMYEIEDYEDDDGSGVNKGQKLAQEINAFDSDSTAWWYLSWLLSETQTFLDDAPYCYVEKVFVNPHEAQVNVKIGRSKSGKLKQNMSQFMRDLLPGTWSFRLSSIGGGHACKSPIGGDGVEDLESNPEIKCIKLNLNTIPERGQLGSRPLSVQSVGGQHISSEDIPQLIRMEHQSKAIKIVRPKRNVELEYEEGLTNKDDAGGTYHNVPSKISYASDAGKLVTGMDTTQNTSSESGMIPESWPCRWAITRSENPKDLLSYSPSRKAPKGTAGRHSVVSHPFNNRLFEKIEECENVHVKDIVVGVHRSPRGLALRYQVEADEDVVFGRIIETKGIIHKISSRIATQLDSRAREWKSLPFDRDALKMIQHHFEKVGVSTDTNRFSNRDLTQLLLLQSIRLLGDKTPNSIGEAVEIWCQNPSIELEIFDEYINGIQPHVRDLVKDGLDDLRVEYQDQGSDVWDDFSTSVEEWQRYTLLNSLGKIMVEAASTFTGVQEEKIAYSIDIENLNVTLYDDDAEGNGCCEAIWRHYQVSNASKAAAGQMRAPPPPSHDFTSIMEKRMLTCREHITHRLAFDIFNGLEIPSTLKRSATAAESLKKNFATIWEGIGVDNIRDAELYSHLSSVLKNKYYPEKSVDEIDQALHVCCTGCFICEGAPMSSALPLSIASRYTSRSLVDDLLNLNPDAPGYANSRDRNRLGVSIEREPEVYPHWRKHYNPEEYSQDYTIPFTIIPNQVGIWVKRDGSAPVPKPIRMVRILDHLQGVNE